MTKPLALVASLLIGAGSLLVPALGVSADTTPTITEYPIPTASADPMSITSGSDGNLWFTESSQAVNKIGRIDPSGNISEYQTFFAGPLQIAAGPDGALWYTESRNAIGRITTSGSISEYNIPTMSSGPYGITAGSDGAMWFAESSGNKIGRITMSGDITEFTLPTLPNGNGIGPSEITSGSDGALWFTTDEGVGRITTSGDISIYPMSQSPNDITAGPDGALWFTNGYQIGRITTAGEVTVFPLEERLGVANAIVAGPDGDIWFTEADNANNIGRMTLSGDVSEYPIPTVHANAASITLGPDGALWFTEDTANNIGRITVPETAPPAPVLDAAIAAGGSGSGDFAADTDFSGGTTYNSSAAVDTSQVNNPAPQSVYQSARYGDDFTYTIPNLTPGDNYTAQLDFNELYWGTPTVNGGVGSRVFNVAVNGSPALTNFDIFDVAGGANKAIAEQLPAIADANGDITLTFTSVKDNAMVNGIEIYSGAVPAEPTTPTVSSAYIAAGGAAVGNFSADTGFGGGSTYTTSATVGTSGAGVTAPESVFQSCRYGDFTYNVPNLVPNTSYNVKLDFSEPVFNTVGSRVFDVAINGQPVPSLTNFDVVAQTGGENIAYSTSGIVATSDAYGNISIAFTSVTNNAMVSGIEVTLAGQ